MQDGERKVSRGEFVSDFLPRGEPWCCTSCLSSLHYRCATQQPHHKSWSYPSVKCVPEFNCAERRHVVRGGGDLRRGVAKKDKVRGGGTECVAWSETQHAAVLPVREPPVSFCSFRDFFGRDVEDNCFFHFFHGRRSHSSHDRRVSCTAES